MLVQPRPGQCRAHPATCDTLSHWRWQVWSSGLMFIGRMAAGRYVRGLRPEQRLKVRPHRNACTYLAPTGEMQGATASRGECSQRQGCMHGGGAELDGRTVAALLADPGVARRVRGWLGGRGLARTDGAASNLCLHHCGCCAVSEVVVSFVVYV